MEARLKQIQENMEKSCWECEAGFMAPCSDCGYLKYRREFYALSHKEQDIVCGIKAESKCGHCGELLDPEGECNCMTGGNM